MTKPTEIKKGDRLLLREGPKLHEATVWELSPSGKHVLLLLKESGRSWQVTQEVLGMAVEVLA